MLNKFKELREANEEGFTLIELLVVIVIIGILAAIALPIFLNQQKAAHEASATADLRNMQRSMEIYALKNGQLPAFTDKAEYVKIFKEAGIYENLITGASDYKRYTICIPDATATTQRVYAIVATAPMLPDSVVDSQGKTTVSVDQTGKVKHMTVNTTSPAAAGFGGGLCSQALEAHIPPAQWQSTWGRWTNNLVA